LIPIRPTKFCRSASKTPRRLRRTAEGGQAPAPAGAGGGILGGLGTLIGGVFGTNNPRGRRLAPGQVVARSVARSVGSEVARDLTKSLGSGAAGRVAGQILRGTLGGVLRR